MAGKILKTLTKHPGYKILALFLALVLWLIVYNSGDPKITRTYTTNVTITNADVISNMNKYYEILDGTNVISFGASGLRSYLDELEDGNFSATADMNRIILDESNETATVPITITSNRYNRYLSYGSTKYLKISLEDIQSKKMAISPAAKGTVAEGYALGEVSVSAPTVLTISGPASVVSQVARVAAPIDVNGMSMALTDNVVPVLYDEDDNVIDVTKLTLSTETVLVKADIVPTKMVSLIFATTGTPEENYQVTGISYTPEKISVKGSSAALNALSAIEIPPEVLNVDGASENIDTTIDITEYLPEGISLTDDDQRTIAVEVTIEGYETKSFILNTSDIVIEGLSNSLQASFPQNRVTIRISGLKTDLDALTEDMVVAAIDLSGYKAGTFSVEVKVDLDDQLYQVQSSSTYVMLSPKNDADAGS